MKKLLLAGVAAAALCGAPAFAADLPTKGPVYRAVDPIFNWTGFYVGGNAGYGWTNNTLTQKSGALSGEDVSGIFTIPQNHHLSGFVGGAQVGLNYQSGNFVWGLEVTYSGSAMDGKSYGPIDDVYTSKMNALGTGTARFGFAADRTLVYAKGGGAWASAKAGIFDPNPGSVNENVRRTHTGWTIGAGLEYALGNNWSVGVEYNYVDLGKETYAYTQFGTATVDVKFDPLHIVWARLNYKFGDPWGKAPVSAKY